MKQFTILFLRLAIVVISVGVLAVCVFLLPLMWSAVPAEFPDATVAVYAILIAMYAAAVPFFFGMYKAWRLLSLIRKGKAFTKVSTNALKAIAIAAGVVSLIYIIVLPFFHIWAQYVDAPGLMVIGMILAGAPMLVALFGALLQMVISEAVDLKSENELTV